MCSFLVIIIIYNYYLQLVDLCLLSTYAPEHHSPEEESCCHGDQGSNGEDQDEVKVVILVERNVLPDGLQPVSTSVSTHIFYPPGSLLDRLLLPVQVEVVDPLKVGCHLLVAHRLPYTLHQLVSCHFIPI